MSSILRTLLFAMPLAAFAQTPTINAVVNAASYSNGPISPGMMVTIFGTNIGPPTLTHLRVGPDGRLVTEIQQTRVLFEGVPAPLIYVSATQTAAMVPYSAAARVAINVIVEYQGVRSTSVVKLVEAAGPGIFSRDASGRGQGAIVNPGGILNSSSDPAKPGDTVEVYFTGEGVLRETVQDGAIATTGLLTRATYTAEIGGRPAVVTYTGAAPGNVFGFAQANVTIPADLPSGGNLPLVLRSGTFVSQAGLTVAVAVPTPPAVTSVFLLHGINQAASDMNAFRATLTGPNGLDPARYTVDAGFDFSDCTQRTSCPASCTMSSGAQRLAQYIINKNPPGDVVLVGYSLGGLVARDLIANNWSNVLGRYRIRLVTLGSPMLGYPNTSLDSFASCGVLLAEMAGNWRATTPPVPQLSTYLDGIATRWRNGSFPGQGTWLSASGRFCATGVRGSTGCRDANLRNDGVVCDDSAAYNITTPAGTAPSRRWQDPTNIYAHTANIFGGLIFGCTASTANPVLSNPAPGPLLNEVLAAIQGTPPPPTPSMVDVPMVLSMSFPEKQRFVQSAIHEGFPTGSADALTMLLLNDPAAAVPVLEEFIAGESDRDTVVVRKAAEWISFAENEAAAGAIRRLAELDSRFAGLASRARDNARHVRKIQ